MKKLLVMMLVAAMTLSMVACGNKDNTNNDVNTENTQDGNVEGTTDNTTDGTETDNNEGTTTVEGVIAPEVAEGTFGAIMWDAFLAEMQNNADATMFDVANNLSMNEAIQFMAGAMEVEEGLLMGFGYRDEATGDFVDVEITGFESGAVFMPMIGSIPFIGYVFDLAEGTDVNAFMTTLTENCNPSWNVCVTADQTLVGAYENTVFFLMCPISNEG